MKEVCGCGASIEIPLATGNAAKSGWDKTMEQLKDWRTGHHHEFPPAEPMPDEPPTIVESGSSHERLGDEYPIQDRALIGFQRNEVR